MTDIHFVLFARLAAKTQVNSVSGHARMPIPQRRQTVRFVLINVLLVADAHGAEFEQSNNHGQYFVSGKLLLTKVASNRSANARQYAAKVGHAIEFVIVSEFTPELVIVVLFAASSILSNRLKVPVGDRANPHVFPCRRNGKPFNARNQPCVPELCTLGIEVSKAAIRTNASDGQVFVVDIPQTCSSRKSAVGFLRFGGVGLRRLHYFHSLSSGKTRAKTFYTRILRLWEKSVQSLARKLCILHGAEVESRQEGRDYWTLRNR
jgi:hypothetical protein